mgnify:CR=1 FL=1
MKAMKPYRQFLKDTIRKKMDFRLTDQNQGVPAPPVERPCPEGAVRLDLPGPDDWSGIEPCDLSRAIRDRRSRRRYRDLPLTLDELAWLLWSTQGITGPVSHGHALRTVPSAGCRHAFETYLAIFRVNGIEPGLYRYLPLSHQLVLEFTDDLLAPKIITASFGQAYPGRAAVTFVWSCIPYRMEWRYGAAAHKVIALDAGHVCQNLYLACEAVACGTCAIAAYDQEEMDDLLGLDGQDEFTIYLAPVGKV